MRLQWLLAMLLITLPSIAADLAPWNDNPRYWAVRGEPVMLVGGSDDDNLFQWPETELVAQLDRLGAAGGNVVRNTMSDRRDKGFEVYPYLQLPSGKYDLEQWNPEYWLRFERFLRETARRGIVVQIELWDRFDYTDSGKIRHWQPHPYNPKNNINYSYWRSGFAPAYFDHPGKNKQPFFFTTPEQHNNRLILGYQQRFIDKVLDHVLEYDHVLICIDNETAADEAWSRYWRNTVKARAAERGKSIYVTEMLDDKTMSKRAHGRTLDHPELYDFIEISQNNHSNGRIHWDNLLAFRDHLAGQPRPMNAIKIYGADGNAFGHSDQQALERFWRNVIGGAAVARFHRPESGLGLNEKAVAALRAVRLLEQRVALWALEPRHAREEGAPEYYEARGGRQRVLYFPAAEAAQGVAVEDCRVAWLDLDRAVWRETASCENLLKPPGPGNWMAVVEPDT